MSRKKGKYLKNMQIKIGDSLEIMFGDSIKKVEVKEIYRVGDKTKVKVGWKEFIFPFSYEYELEWLKNRVEEAVKFKGREQLRSVEI